MKRLNCTSGKFTGHFSMASAYKKATLTSILKGNSVEGTLVFLSNVYQMKMYYTCPVLEISSTDV